MGSFDDLEDDDQRPRRGSRRRDDEDDDRPRGRRADDDDYEDEYPRPRRYGREGEGPVGMAITGMVLGIIALVLSFIPCAGWFLAFIPAVLGLIFSGIGLSQAARSAGAGKKMAIAGLATSVLAFVLAPLMWFLLVRGAAAGIQGAIPPVQINPRPVPGQVR